MTCVATALSVLACREAAIASPRPESVQPAGGSAGTSTPVVIRGDGFLARATQPATGRPTLDDHLRAWLGETELLEVTWIDAGTLHATVPPGLPAGASTLVVENAFGRRGRLDAAFEVFPSTGGSLAATAEASASTVSLGQRITLTSTVTNTGSAAVTGISAAAVATSEAGATASLTEGPTPPSFASLGPGESATFTWTFTATAAGLLQLAVSVMGIDGSSGAEVRSPPASVPVTVQMPAGLAATLVASRATANTDQPIGVTFNVTNGGGATAAITAVEPSAAPASDATCGAVSPALPTTVASGRSRSFTWTCASSVVGELTLGGAATGTDAGSGAPVSAAASPATVTVQQPAALHATIAVGGTPTTVSVGQALEMTFTVTNAGGASASVASVAPTVSPESGASCQQASPAPPVTLEGGASRTFTWICTPAAAGAVTLSATVAGQDANTGAPLAATASPGAQLTVQLPAALAATIGASPSRVSVRQSVTVTFTVVNGGSATADILSIAPSASGIGSVDCGEVSPELPRSIRSGQSRTFSWTCTPNAPGELSLSGTAAGRDANSGASLSASPATPATVTVQSRASLGVTAFSASRTTVSVGQAIDLALTLHDTGGATANVSAIAPTPPAADCESVGGLPRAIRGGESATFTWTCRPPDAGSLTLGANVTAVDANSGAPVAPNVSGIPVTVQTAAVLVATLSSVTPGPTVTMELELANSGGAPARVSAVTPTASDSTVTCDGASPAPPRTIDGAGASGTPSQRFSWTCTGSGVTATLGATVAASDANTGLDISPTVAGVVVIFAG